MRALFEQLKIHLWMILHHRWSALIAAAVFCALGWAGLKLTKDEFVSEARVYLDAKAALRPLIQGSSNSEQAWTPEDSALLIKRTLVTRDTIEKVISEIGVQPTDNTPQAMDKLILQVSKKIRVDRVMPGADEETQEYGRRATDIYRISYKTDNAERAAKIVTIVLDLFSKRLSDLTTTGAAEAAEFLDREIESYAEKLNVAEDQLKQFKIAHPDVLLDKDGKSYSERLQTLERDLESARLSMREAEFRAAAFRTQIQSIGTTRTISGGAGPTVLDQRIEAMETKLAELLTNYTDQHPEVVGLRKSIADLKEQKRKGLDKAVGGTSVVSVGGDTSAPRLMLADAEARAAAMREQVQLLERQVADLKPLAGNMPKIEAELAKLNRDYDVIKQTYGQLVQRREAIRLAEGAQTSGASMFKVIEAPRVPTIPVSPKRTLVTTIIFLASIALGIGVAYIRAQSRPTFYTRSQLTEAIGVPVLGAVSMNWNMAQVVQRRLSFTAFAAMSLLLLMSYIGMMSYYGLDLEKEFKKVAANVSTSFGS